MCKNLLKLILADLRADYTSRSCCTFKGLTGVCNLKLPSSLKSKPSHTLLVAKESSLMYLDTNWFSSVLLMVNSWAPEKSKIWDVKKPLQSETNANHGQVRQRPTHALTDALGFGNVVHAVVVEAHIEEVTVVLVLHPHGRPSVLMALVGLWHSLQPGS